jgi:hypothetical protein
MIRVGVVHLYWEKELGFYGKDETGNVCMVSFPRAQSGNSVIYSTGTMPRRRGRILALYAFFYMGSRKYVVVESLSDHFVIQSPPIQPPMQDFAGGSFILNFVS